MTRRAYGLGVCKGYSPPAGVNITLSLWGVLAAVRSGKRGALPTSVEQQGRAPRVPLVPSLAGESPSVCTIWHRFSKSCAALPRVSSRFLLSPLLSQTAAKAKVLRRGVKEVVKAVRKGEQGFVVIAGDISPIDVIAHLPILCEDKELPYCYVPSKEQLGQAGCTKRPTSCVMIKSHADVDNFAECKKGMCALCVVCMLWRGD